MNLLVPACEARVSGDSDIKKRTIRKELLEFLEGLIRKMLIFNLMTRR